MRLLTAGVVEVDNPDWLHGALHWGPSLDLPTAARDAALRAAAALDAVAGADSTFVERGAEWDVTVEAAWAQHLWRAEAADAALVGAQAASLDGARRIARELHLLRRAIDRLVHTAPRPLTTSAAEDRGTELRQLVAAIVGDAAAGRSLLNSEALAAVEVAHQLRLPLVAMAGGAHADAARSASWYTRARTRLDRLTRRLIAAKGALQEAVASEASVPVAAAEDDEVRASWWATRAAGVHLSQPTPLASAYGLHTQPTHVVPGYANTLDWICLDASRLDVVGVAPLPPLEELTREVAMPSTEWPSDHVSLCCDLAWSGVIEHASGRGAPTPRWRGPAFTPRSPRRKSGPWAAEEPAAAGSWIWRT